MAGGAAPQGTFLQLKDGRFIDDRWVGGRWDLSKFANAQGETDWDAVIDAGECLYLCSGWGAPHLGRIGPCVGLEYGFGIGQRSRVVRAKCGV